MCLITTQSKPKIAIKDKIVYKILDPYCQSIYFDFYYEVDKLYQTKIEESSDNTTFDDYDNKILKEEYGINWTFNPEVKSYGSGFHSILYKKRIKSVLKDSDGFASINEGVMWKCIIPKGSEYYINPSGLVVSNQIIIKERIK